nr:hypothetical protein [uncultured Desulfobulbus sp.]
MAETRIWGRWTDVQKQLAKDLSHTVEMTEAGRCAATGGNFSEITTNGNDSIHGRRTAPHLNDAGGTAPAGISNAREKSQEMWLSNIFFQTLFFESVWAITSSCGIMPKIFSLFC